MVDHSRQSAPPKGRGQAPKAPAADAPSGEGDRVAKALARAGVASRREVERLIEAGRVALNGQVLTTPAVKVAKGDILTLDGKPVEAAEAARVWRYHKPAGLVTSNGDPQGRPTVFDQLPKELPRTISVGRLDMNTEGLLLLTNDGGLARQLELPANAMVRRYRARAFGRVDSAKLEALKDGVTIEGVAYGAIEARIDKAQGTDRKTGSANLWISVAITEGKNREVRRVLEHLGLKVNRLIRLAYGPFALADLALGEVQEVGPRVIREQLAAYIDPSNLPSSQRAAPGPVVRSQTRGPGRRTRTSERAAAEGVAKPGAAASSPEAPAKPVYKAGWAKPKKRSGPVHAMPRASAKPDMARPARVKSEAPATSRAARKADAPRSARPAPAKTGAVFAGPRPKRSGPAEAGGKPGSARPAGAAPPGKRPPKGR